MAPIAPRTSHRAKALARIADPTLPRKVHRADNTVTDDFLHSKRDKQLIRKATFRAKISEKLSERGLGGKKLKRRRPSKKLVATLESLADALPELEDAPADAAAGPHVRRQRSIRTRPGSLKRKEKVVQAEMARFGLNLAQLTAVPEATVAADERMEMGAHEASTKDAVAVSVAAASAPSTSSTSESTVAAPAKKSTANRFALLRNYITATMEQSPAFAKKE